MVKPKQRSKPSNSPNITKQKKINKQRFIDCYKNKQNVFLYGNDFFDTRSEFIKNIWIEDCGGVDKETEYFLEDISIPPKNPTSKQELENKFKKDWTDENKTIDSLSHKGNSYYEELDTYIATHAHITDRTWRYVDCNGWSGKKVYDELVNCIGDRNDHILYNSRRSCVEGVMKMGYLLVCKGLIFLDNLRYSLGDKEDEFYYRKLVKVIKERKEHFPRFDPIGKRVADWFVDTQFNWLVLYTRINSDFPIWFRGEGEFRETPLPIQSKAEFGQQEGSASQPETEKVIKLKIVKDREEVYWEGRLLPTVKGKDFDILHKLAKTPGKSVKNDKLYEFIDSDYNEGVLLNQRMTEIRNAFPPPYNDIKQSQCIIPDAKRNKGYRCLNLTKEQVEIA